MKYVDIVSRFGDVTLRVTPIRHPWDTASTQPAWDVQLTGPDLDCSGVFTEDGDAPQTLVEFFAELAEEQKGWDGDKHWNAIADQLKIRANHDQINSTLLYVTLCGGVEPRWTALSELHVDPGRFDRVSKNLELYGSEIFGDEYDPECEPVRRDPRKLAREPLKKIGSG